SASPPVSTYSRNEPSAHGKAAKASNIGVDRNVPRTSCPLSHPRSAGAETRTSSEGTQHVAPAPNADHTSHANASNPTPAQRPTRAPDPNPNDRTDHATRFTTPRCSTTTPFG